MKAYVFEERLGQLLDMVPHFVYVVLLLADSLHLVGNELHEGEEEERKEEECQKQKSRHLIKSFSQKLTSSNRSVGLYGEPRSDTNRANAMPSSTFIRKSSSERDRWPRKAPWEKKKHS